jgi:hypothetical protein
MRKIEINFSKFITTIRKLLGEIILKPILIQLTIKEVEIGIDLNLLDSIMIEWVAFNEYDKLGELEILAKKIEVATNLVAFGVQTDASGTERNYLPISWVVENYLDFTPEQRVAMEDARKREAIELGFMTADGVPIPHGDDAKDDEEDGNSNEDPTDDSDYGLDDEDAELSPTESDDDEFSK